MPSSAKSREPRIIVSAACLGRASDSPHKRSLRREIGAG